MVEESPADTIERLIGLGHLAGGIGHHVINAFSAIVSNAEILRLTAGEPDAPDPIVTADTIIKTAVEASSVARRLIDYTRPITFIGDDTVSLDALIARVVEEERAKERPGVEWRTELTPVPTIRGHGDQLRSMFAHLIANAIEAMPQGGGSITLAAGLDARGWVALEVRDTGKGMSPEEVLRAVEPFFTTKPGRFGVGLSIANGIWRRHRGTLALKTRPGEGTQVRLCVDPVEKPLLGLRR